MDRMEVEAIKKKTLPLWNTEVSRRDGIGHFAARGVGPFEARVFYVGPQLIQASGNAFDHEKKGEIAAENTGFVSDGEIQAIGEPDAPKVPPKRARNARMCSAVAPRLLNEVPHHPEATENERVEPPGRPIINSSQGSSSFVLFTGWNSSLRVARVVPVVTMVKQMKFVVAAVEPEAPRSDEMREEAVVLSEPRECAVNGVVRKQKRVEVKQRRRERCREERDRGCPGEGEHG